MKKSRSRRWWSLLLAIAMVATIIPFHSPIVLADEPQKVLDDGINDQWTLENTVGEDAICALEEGWLHLKSGAGNDNTPSSGRQLMVVNPNSFDFNKEGYFSFTMKSNNDSPSNDRFGVYLGYNTAKNGMFVGYDSGGLVLAEV